MANFDAFMQLNVLAALEAVEELAEERPRAFREPVDPFQLSDIQFSKIYRVTKNMCRFIIELVRPHITPATRHSSLDVTRKVLVALCFYASGSYQMDGGSSMYACVSQPSVSRCIAEVTDALCLPQICQQWVRFPAGIQELRERRQRFYNHYHLPGVIGCIDCTHVAIVAPPKNDAAHPEHIYVNRKGYHSINVQLICDDRLQILNVNAKYPGSTHDAFIWRNTHVSAAMAHLHRSGHADFYLIGDSGYPLRPWLLTPIAGAVEGTPEDRYNTQFTRTRSLIERCNGLLKARFRCLLKHRVLHYTPEKAAKIVNACVVLHNMCIAHNVPPPEMDDEDDDELGIIQNNPEAIGRNIDPDLAAGRHYRQGIVAHFKKP